MVEHVTDIHLTIFVAFDQTCILIHIMKLLLNDVVGSLLYDEHAYLINPPRLKCISIGRRTAIT